LDTVPVRVYYPSPPGNEVLEDLRRAVPEGVEILSGEQPDAYDVIIEGRPAAENLEAQGLKAVIVPFAGVPESTLALLRERPALSLHNLHHNAAETAEMGMALLMAAAKRIVPCDRLLRLNDWTPRYMPSQSVRLDGKRALVLGYGKIGRRIAQCCVSLGMKVAATRRSQQAPQADGSVVVHPAASLKTLLGTANVLVIALPQSPETIGLIGKAELNAMPPGGILVNIARAAIVDEEALFEALKGGHLHSAGLDVWYAYPQAQAGAVPSYFSMPDSAKDTPPSRFPFGELDNVVLSPHRAGVSMDTEKQRVADLATMLTALHNGKPMPNRVSTSAGY
jgi:phosphoglycerate dehydrogenase-like enzyme